MNIRSKAIIFLTVLVFGTSVLSVGNAYAGNGTRFLGFSARDSGMAGATTASSEDTSCLVRNPAGLTQINNRVDVEYLNILPHNVTMHTEGALSNAGQRQTSNIDYLPGVNAGVSYKLPGIDKYPVSVGVGVFSMAGIALNYATSRITEVFVQGYDKMVDLRSLRIAPGLAVAITDKLSVGATANIAIQGLRTNLAQSTAPYPQTTGEGDWDFVPGAGFTVGLLYDFNEMLNVGASYESHGWMQHHHKYKDVLPFIDEPPVINVGISFKPIKDLELTYDTRYINWTDVKLARNGPESGGFGWGDQWVFAIGSEYTYKDKLKLRLGYNYGKSPIQAHVVFANALLPVIMEHHLTTGFSYYITKNWSVDLVWEHHYVATKADNGCGDAYSVNGAGTKVTAGADIIGVGMGYAF